MFSHHILKPERTPIEANVWGTPKSSGSFSNLFPARLLRALDYREAPTEVNGRTGQPRACSPAFTGRLEPTWRTDGPLVPRGIYLSCGDSADTGLPPQSVDLVVTDPPFFDNVHYSELADFFYAWQQIGHSRAQPCTSTTRHPSEVQDADAGRFADKLTAVFRECHRVLKHDGLLAFTYHHSRNEGWSSLAQAILGTGFVVVNSQPVKAEMSGATPKSQAKVPIQLDIIVVCRKQESHGPARSHVPEAIHSARQKLRRLCEEGLSLSRNDRKIVLFGQLLTTLESPADAARIADGVETQLPELNDSVPARARGAQQRLLFEES